MPAAESVHVALQIELVSENMDRSEEEQRALLSSLNSGCLACLMDTDGTRQMELACFPEGSARPPLFHNARTCSQASRIISPNNSLVFDHQPTSAAAAAAYLQSASQLRSKLVARTTTA